MICLSLEHSRSTTTIVFGLFPYTRAKHVRELEEGMKRKNEKSPLELYYEQQNPEQESEGEEESETLSLSLSLSEDEECEQEKEEKKPPVQGVILSNDQKDGLNHAKAGTNIFLTGSAGTGKSIWIEQVCKELRAMKKSVALTASTGLAAFQLGLGACTLHAFSGVGLGQDTAQKLLDHVRTRPSKLKLWRMTDVLIVDEFSMISADFFIKLDFIAKKVRGCPKFFGGIQLILVGDYFQCPSIEKQPKPDQPRFPFLTPLWNEGRILSIALKTNFRQSGDLDFFQLLERVKLGDVKYGDVETLSSRLIEKHPGVDRNGLTKLCPTRKAVELINREAMGKIQSPSHTYKGDFVKYDHMGRPVIQKDGDGDPEKKYDRYPADYLINLKVGVEVLLCCNEDMERGLVNGARGKVIRFESTLGEDAGPDDKLYPLVLMENGEEFLATPHVWETKNEGVLLESFTQIPLLLRYAMTIHKAQGMTLGKVLVKCDFFENGQGYVALSRVRNLSDLYLEGLDMSKFTTHPDVIKFYRERKLLS